MYVRFVELNGTLETLDEINKAWTRETGDPTPWTDPDDLNGPDDDHWKSWIEYSGGKTYILADLDGKDTIQDHIVLSGHE